MKTNKMLGLTLLLLGILNILFGAGFIYAMILVSGIFANPLLAAAAPGLTGFFAFGWLIGLLQFVAGLVSVVTAAFLFKEK